MENKKTIKLKRKKENKLSKISSLFADKKKRYLYMFLILLPLLIAIGFFAFNVYKEAKNLLSLAKGTTETKAENVVESMNYVLRDNATDLQKEYFAQLKDAIESDDSTATDAEIAGLVCKNYVADFYTWTNKQGQYDIGGFYYLFSEKDETVTFKENAYLKARDGFYKYINEYIDEYGSENLLEVDSVEVVKAEKLDDKYTIHQWVETIQVGEDEYDIIYDDVDYDAYYVTCSWTYKDCAMDLNKFDKRMNFIVVKNEGRYEIVEASTASIEIGKANEVENEE